MDDNSSSWIHVTQGWAGTGFGMIHIPRVGQEVLVDFLGGDPDRPIIVGKVYTNLQKVPYKLPDNKTQSGWKSNSTPGGGGYNEIMFEDKKGSELVNIQAQKDLNKLVKNNETETTGVNRTISVGKNRTMTVGENDTAAVGVLHSVTITPTAPGGMGPAPSPTTSITMVDKQIALTTGGAAIVLDTNDISLTAAGNIVLAAQGAIVLQATDIVKIDGKYVFINCTEDPPEEIPVEEGFNEDRALDMVKSVLYAPIGAVIAGAEFIWSLF
jgi:type VI secretion system secreted protein VgrG